MGDVIYLCESCMNQRARWIVDFEETMESPAESHKVCHRCIAGLEKQGRLL